MSKDQGDSKIVSSTLADHEKKHSTELDTKSQKRKSSTTKEDAEMKDTGETTENPHSSLIQDEVHSANDWEHADLGNNARNDKFLRLLGANKVEHKGKVVIGDQATNQHRNPDPEKLTSDLESQFQHGLEHKLKSGRGHIGLGFGDEPVAPERVNKVTKFADSDESEKEENTKDEKNEKEETVKEEPPTKKKFLGFVKSSD